MTSVNKVIIVGRLGQDPDVRQFSNGGGVTHISVATSEKWTDRNTGEPREQTEWHRISLFNRLGEIAAQYLRKGALVYIEGSLHTRKYTDQQGVERFAVEIRASEMRMLGSANNNQGNWGGQNQGGSFGGQANGGYNHQNGGYNNQNGGYSNQSHGGSFDTQPMANNYQGGQSGHKGNTQPRNTQGGGNTNANQSYAGQTRQNQSPDTSGAPTGVENNPFINNQPNKMHNMQAKAASIQDDDMPF